MTEVSSEAEEKLQLQVTEEIATKPLSNGHGQQDGHSTPESKAEKTNKAKIADAPQKSPKIAEAPKIGKPSAGELKASKKAEKAARRAKEKGPLQGQPIASLQGGNDGTSHKDIAKRGSNAQSQSLATGKDERRRRGSSTSKSLSLRQADSSLAHKPTEPKKEEKKVALFDHLYGHPRRTTIAGATKDVHPTVLALGLQMSNYVICGSNARCVAMLLVFKRVRNNWISYHCLLICLV